MSVNRKRRRVSTIPSLYRDGKSNGITNRQELVARLINWGNWAKNTSVFKELGYNLPMRRMYKSGTHTCAPDYKDALYIEALLLKLPKKQRFIIKVEFAEPHRIAEDKARDYSRKFRKRISAGRWRTLKHEAINALEDLVYKNQGTKNPGS